MRVFKTGATRDSDESKFDYEGFLSPAVLERYAAYLHKHRIQSDGNVRSSDNWQLGISKDVYMKSLFRHFMDMWKEHRGLPSRDGRQDAICGLLFNAMGYLFEDLKEQVSIMEKGPIGWTGRAAPTRPEEKNATEASSTDEKSLPELYP